MNGNGPDGRFGAVWADWKLNAGRWPWRLERKVVRWLSGRGFFCVNLLRVVHGVRNTLFPRRRGRMSVPMVLYAAIVEEMAAALQRAARKMNQFNVTARGVAPEQEDGEDV